MLNQGTFYIALLVATFFSSLVAGLLFVFATVVMPGIERLNHAEFIRAFQVIDGRIQNNQPLFVLVWVGSVLALAVAAVLGMAQLTGWMRLLLMVAVSVYLLGVQLPTVTINIPLNNELQTLRVETMNTTLQQQARQKFELRWNRWNTFRTIWASLTSVLLLVVVLAL